MSEFELVTLYTEMSNASAEHFMKFTTGLFSMLVTAYFAGPKLTRAMAAVVVALFSMFTLITGMSVAASLDRVSNLASVIRGARESNQELAWFAVPPHTLYVSFSVFVASVLVLSYLAALVFFFYTRHHPRET